MKRTMTALLLAATVAGSGLAVAAPANAAGGKTYTAAQVAQHASTTSCWSSINGSVYNLTSWVNRHPGGKRAIQSLCGKDGTRAFMGQHGMGGRPAAMLATFKIGTLKK